MFRKIVEMRRQYLLRGQKRWLERLVEQGLQIGEGSMVFDLEGIGSEPYLISIGKHVVATSGVTFITHDNGTEVLKCLREYVDVVHYGRITVHDNCHIGLDATIMPGVTIGPNSIVAAGAVVYHDVPPNTVARGNPAKFAGKVSDFAEYALAVMPPYDVAAYKRDKRKEVTRFHPRPW